MDDEAPIRRFIVQALKPLGYQLLEASDGREAIALGLRENPEIALLDIRVPEKDGIEVLAELKKNNPAIVGIVMSGFADEDVQQQVGEMGAFAFLVKPFELKIMLEKIQEAVKFLSS